MNVKYLRVPVSSRLGVFYSFASVVNDFIRNRHEFVSD